MVFNQVLNQLQALAAMVVRLSDDQYTCPIRHLGGATIGGHARHIAEMLQCVIQGYSKGTIDYLNRFRDLELEKDRSRLLAVIDQLTSSLHQADRSLSVMTQTDQGSEQPCVYTSYYRELAFNAEHATHHMALIRVALIEMGLSIVTDDFGVAPATLKYKSAQACAQ